MPADAELTADGRSSMTSSALALASVLVDDRTGAGGNSGSLSIELLQRATRDDYDRWLATALAAGGCVRPVRLCGTVRDVDTVTGEVLDGLDTEDLPDRAIYVPCGDRRASVCPPCAETYRADTYQLIRAGLAGGKGMPESLAAHPCVFATFTAPSFGPVHTRVVTSRGTVARCRPRRKATFCPHGRRISCGQRHKASDACLGRPLCPDCYDYSAAVVWNAHAPELWRRTTIAIRRRLDKLAKVHGTRVKLSYAKVAEYQKRGLIHFHAVFRLDGHDPAHPEQTIPPHPAFTAEVITEVIQQVASTTWFAIVSHPAKPRGWDITWGAQIDPQVIRLTGDGEITDSKVASYLAKYATKSTEPVGVLPGRITANNASIYADPGTYEGRLIAACLRLGAYPHEDFRALRCWAHMFGYRGHFATKSRRYSTTTRVLRAARRDWVRRQQPTAKRDGDKTVITITDLRWAGQGWRTTGDALVALSGRCPRPGAAAYRP
jgi:Replication initiator protein, pSAM2